MFFKADNGGEFLTKQPVKNLKIDNKWHEVELRFRQSELQLIWDGVLVNSVSDVSSEEQVIGFRSGGPFETIIDDVKVIDHNGNTIISESFRNSHNWWRLFLLFLAFSAFTGALCFFAASMAGVQSQTTAKWALLIQTSISSMLLFYLCFDYCFYSNCYPYAHVQQWKSVSSELCFFENIRLRFFSLFSCFDTVLRSVKEGAGGKQQCNFLQPRDHEIAPAGYLEAQVIWSGAHGEEIRIIPIPQLINFFNSMPMDSFYKIIFLGTSQTWGEGAASRKKQMVFQVYRSLRDICGYNGNFLVVNAGLRAADSNAMLKILKVVFDAMRFEMVVVNLSNNDKPAGFKGNLLEMSEVTDRNKAKIILVKEANSPNSDSMRLRENHRVIEGIALEKSIPCIDMHTYLSSPGIVDSGFLWWDSVHLTSYGQAIAGEVIAREIHGLLKYCRDSTHTVGTSVFP